MKRWIITLFVAGLLLTPTGAQAADSPGCEGLSEFRAELFPIGERWAADLREVGVGGEEWSPATLSSDDWLAYADIALEVHRDLKELEPPGWVAAWLDVRIDSTALQEQIGKAAAQSGMLIVLGFSEEIEALDQRDNETRKAAIAQCSDFEQFVYDWDALDGEVDGTPVSVPKR